MSRRLILLLAGLFIAALTGFMLKDAYCVEATVGLPVMVKSSTGEEKADPLQWDFGKVTAGEVLKHDFILKNETYDLLEIVNIHTSCGCTVSKSGKKSLLPQESTQIAVSFNSKGYSGPVSQYVYVHTDSADLSIIKFTIKAQVVKED